MATGISDLAVTQDQLLDILLKFSVVRLVSGVSDHFEHVVGVLLGVLLRNLLLDLLRDFLWLPVGSSVVAS